MEARDIAENIELLLGKKRWSPGDSSPVPWDDAKTRLAAALQLARENTSDVAAVAALARAALIDEEEDVRKASLESLVELAPSDVSTTILIAATFDPDWDIRLLALELLNSLKLSSIRNVARRLVDDDDGSVSNLAHEILDLIEKDPP